MALTKVSGPMTTAGTVSVFDFMTPVEISDVKSRLCTKNVTDSIQRALDYAEVTRQSVYIPAGKYLITQIAIPSGLHVFGDTTGGYGSQTAEYLYDSTVLFQDSGVNDDAIVFDCPVESGFFRIFNTHLHSFILLKKGTSDTIGNGISARQVNTDRDVAANHCLVNGITAFEKILVRGFPENGMYFKQGAVPLYCSDLDFIFNGGYGLRIDGNNYVRNVVLRNIAGDGNTGRACIFIASPSNDTQVTVDGLYSEYRSDASYGNSVSYPGAQPYGIELGDFGDNSSVHITNALQESIVTDTAASAVIFITSSSAATTPNVIFSGVKIADLTALSGQKKVLIDNRSWDAYTQFTIPATVTFGVYSLVDTGNTVCTQFANGHTAFGNGFQKPTVSSEGAQVYGALPSLSWYESDAAVDTKGWSIGPSSGSLYFRSFNDAGSAGSNYLQITRSGSSISRIIFLEKVRITGISTFADNTSAISGGLGTGDIYKTATGELRIVI